MEVEREGVKEEGVDGIIECDCTFLSSLMVCI